MFCFVSDKKVQILQNLHLKYSLKDSTEILKTHTITTSELRLAIITRDMFNLRILLVVNIE